AGKSKELRTNILLGVTIGAGVFTGVAAIWLVDWHGGSADKKDKDTEGSKDKDTDTKDSNKEKDQSSLRLGVGLGSVVLPVSVWESGMNAASFPLRLGNYEPLLELASGGMATVYVARQVGAAGFERLVVVKRVHRHHLGNREFYKMFIDEAHV